MLKTRAGEIIGTAAVVGAPEHVIAQRLLRFSDLKKLAIVNNWPALLRWIATEGFPPGIRLGPNSRAWPKHEVMAWLESRRIERKVA